MWYAGRLSGRPQAQTAKKRSLFYCQLMLSMGLCDHEAAGWLCEMRQLMMSSSYTKRELQPNATGDIVAGLVRVQMTCVLNGRGTNQY